MMTFELLTHGEDAKSKSTDLVTTPQAATH
jgi:hypothetical protein